MRAGLSKLEWILDDLGDVAHHFVKWKIKKLRNHQQRTTQWWWKWPNRYWSRLCRLLFACWWSCCTGHKTSNGSKSSANHIAFDKTLHMVKSTAPQHSTKAKAALNNPNLVEVQPKVQRNSDAIIFHNGILLLLVDNLRTAPPRLSIKLITVATINTNPKSKTYQLSMIQIKLSFFPLPISFSSPDLFCFSFSRSPASPLAVQFQWTSSRTKLFRRRLLCKQLKLIWRFSRQRRSGCWRQRPEHLGL